MSTLSLWKQRLGYGAADLGCNLIWQMITLYLMYYYTDIVALPVASITLLLLIVRLIDGFAGIGIGIIIDKTHTRWGKSRPYLLFGAIPLGLFAILTFYNPDSTGLNKLKYAYVTYIGLVLSYGVVNAPLTSILPSLTNDATERTRLATSRIAFSFIGAAIVSVFALPMMNSLGHGSMAIGIFRTVLIFSLTALLMLFLSFCSLRENYIHGEQNTTTWQSLSTLKSNYPWMIFVLNILFMWGGYFLQQGTLIYFFKYNVNRPDLITTFAGITTIVPVFGSLLTIAFSKKLLKRSLYQLASSFYLGGIIIMIAAGSDITTLIIGNVISALGFGFRHSIYFSMQADPIDYGIWKTGVNAAGLISSLNGFFGKLAMAAAGAISVAILKSAHYYPGSVQTASTLLAIKVCYLYIPATLTVTSVFIMSFYNIDNKLILIREEIDALRKNQLFR